MGYFDIVNHVRIIFNSLLKFFEEYVGRIFITRIKLKNGILM